MNYRKSPLQSNSMISDKKNLLVSIDGGATKTIVQLSTIDGHILGKARGGAANIANDVEGSWHSIITPLQEILKNTNLNFSDVRLYGGVGVAGTELPSACEQFRKTAHIFENLILKSDAHTSCLGAHDGKDGAIIAIGTGTVALALFNQKERKLSGWGFPQDDQGGGAWIGLQLISDMLRSRDGRKPRSDLTNRVYDYLSQNGNNPMIWAVGANSSKFATLVPLVIQAAEEGDIEANNLLNQAANIISSLAKSLLEDEFRDLPICLLGGLSEFLIPRLDPSIKARIVAPTGCSLEGAYYLALQAYKEKGL